MAKVKSAPSTTKVEKPKVSRPGVHSKCKTSKLKSSKNYKKLYNGQGQYDQINNNNTEAEAKCPI